MGSGSSQQGEKMSRSPRLSMSSQTGGPPPEQEVKETYLQALYVVLWKPIYVVLVFAHGLLASWLINQIWPEPIGYAYAIAFVVSAPLAYVELEWFGRAMHWDSGPIIQWRERSTVLVAVGFAIALALAITLAVNESDSREQARRHAQEMEAEKARMHKLTSKVSNQDTQRAMRFMEALRAAREARDGKK
jgi:hypothetical protein